MKANLEPYPVIDYPWIPDAGDGTYRNPILCADYSDPDIVRVGADYWLTASSFNCTPGLPLLHSRDLVNWTLVNHAVKNLPHPRFEQVQPGCGVWAPAIRYHAGRFWIFFPMPDEGIYMATASDPAGTWSPPHLVQEGKGLIDPCPLWDDDGCAYLVHAYARSRAGMADKLHIRPMSPDGRKLTGPGSIIVDDPARHPTIEGPKFLKRNDWYYVLAPAGGVEKGYQVALRSRTLMGPYEDRVVLESGSTPVNGPHQGVLVDTPAGQWWFVHFQDAGYCGRIVHLQPVSWRDDWPMMGLDRDQNGIGEPVLRHPKPDVARQEIAVPQTSDEFDLPTLGLQWQWYANHREDWYSLTQRPGVLRLFAQPLREGLFHQPNLLLQKLPARRFVVHTAVSVEIAREGTQAGLVMMGMEHAAVVIRRSPAGYQLVQIVNDRDVFAQRLVSSRAVLRMEVSDGGLCTFSYSLNGREFVRLQREFQAQKGKWIGAKVGVFCTGCSGGYADVEILRFTGVS